MYIVHMFVTVCSMIVHFLRLVDKKHLVGGKKIEMKKTTKEGEDEEEEDEESESEKLKKVIVCTHRLIPNPLYIGMRLLNEHVI